MLMLILVFVGWLLVTGFYIWLLTYCLRVGAVGTRSGGDAHRHTEPIRYWTGIAVLAGGAVGLIGIFVYALWIALS